MLDTAPRVAGTPDIFRQKGGGQLRALSPAVDHHQQQEAVTAFLAALCNGEFDALLFLLHPAVVLRADEAAVRGGASRLLVSPEAVAGTLSGCARAARPALIDGVPGAVWFWVDRCR